MIFDCPQCHQKLEGDVSFGGSEIDCPACHYRFVLPVTGMNESEKAGSHMVAAGTRAEDKYRFHGQIAKGGMGKIVSATDTRLDRAVAVKKLAGPDEDPVQVRQLIREAQITARLSHPGIVPIHELGRDAEGRVYYAMKHIRGEPLDKVIEKLRASDKAMIEKSPFRRLLLIFCRICDAIGYANEMGIVHRDIKPDNIMLASYGEYLLIDWGIAKDLNNKNDEDPAEQVVSDFRYRPEPGDFGATLHGAVFGSPSYMSPEQARGDIHAIDARSDVFGLGALLFEILTLSPPYEGETPEDAVKSAARCDIKRIPDIIAESPDPENPFPHIAGGELPDSVKAVAMKAMQMNPEDRYQSAAELRREVEAYLTGYTTEAENAGFLKIVRLAVSRHRRVANALAFGAVMAGVAIAITADMNYKETQKARRAGAEAVEYVEKVRKAREQRLLTSLKVAPDYADMARLLANRGEEEDALVVARLAVEYDPGLTDAAALVKALEIHASLNRGEPFPEAVPVGDRPSLDFLLRHPQMLSAAGDSEFPEQTLTRLSRAYSEAGLSRLAGQITAGQMDRVERYRQQISQAWQGTDIEWELSLAPGISSLCFDEEDRSHFTAYESWATDIKKDFPGQILHLDIHSAEVIPDLSIVSRFAIESLTFGPDTEVSAQDLKDLTNCRFLKVISFQGAQPDRLSFLGNIPLVALRLNPWETAVDPAPLADCQSLRVLAGNFTDLNSLPGGHLQVFSGHSRDGDYTSLANMPLRYLEIHGGDESTDLSPLDSLPVQTLVADGVDLQKNRATLASWPLQVLSVDSPSDVNADEWESSLPLLTSLRIRDGHWAGDVSKVFPALRKLVDETGMNFGRFMKIDSLETIEIDGGGECVCYLSALERVASGKDLYISPDMPVEVLPRAVALNMVNQNWEAAERELENLVEHIGKHPRLTIASVNASQLEKVIANRSDPDQLFFSRMRRLGESHYQAVFCGLTRPEAEQFAAECGGALAKIDSYEEENFLRGLIRSRPEYGAFWVEGYNPEVREGDLSKDSEAPVLPGNRDKRLTRPVTCLFPVIIEWK